MVVLKKEIEECHLATRADASLVPSLRNGVAGDALMSATATT